MTDLNKKPRVCIIGAGPCGLTAAKNLLQQGLTDFVVFEKNSVPGGNWVFDESNEHSSIYETTHVISSKNLSSFEDFPMPDDYPDYPSHQQILKYFNEYAEHFGVLPYIRFNSSVVAVDRLNEKEWQISWEDKTGLHQQIFDYLFMANGHHSDPFTPKYPGEFSGQMLHSHQYKRAAPFKDQRVLVVGGGNSACDVAVEVSRIAKKTCISMRRGQHIFPKFMFGKPTDIAFAKIRALPFWMRQAFATGVIRILQGKYSKYHLKKPVDKALEAHPTINSELLYFIRHGKILPRDGIERFDGDKVVFVDGQVESFDTVIFATGYKTSFPFLDKKWLDFSEALQVPLYHKMIHPEFENLYFIGLFQPQGCIWPLADHQAHIAARIIAGSMQRPDNLDEKVAEEMRLSGKRFRASPRHALEVDYHIFRNQLLKTLSR